MPDRHEEMEVYYETLNDRPDIGWFLQGHIVLEFMLRKRLSEINPAISSKLAKSGFYRVMMEAHKAGIINDERKSVLEAINSIRNKYAHELSYRPTLAEWIQLWENAQKAFVDMTDGIEQGLAELRSVRSLEDADLFHLNELFVQLCHDI